MDLSGLAGQGEARRRSILCAASDAPCSDVSGVITPQRQLLTVSVCNTDGALHMTEGLKAPEPHQEACWDALRWSSRPTAGLAETQNILGEEIAMNAYEFYTSFVWVILQWTTTSLLIIL